MGYTGGSASDPTYHHLGDHTEALQVDFDPSRIGYGELLDLFWRSHDPTRPGWSTQYRAAVWFADDAQREIAAAGGQRAARERGAELATAIEPLRRFYRAEDYHQKYGLRHERVIADELLLRYGEDRAMVDSTAAARINGYLGGYGRRAQLEALAPKLGLTAASQSRLLARVS